MTDEQQPFWATVATHQRKRPAQPRPRTPQNAETIGVPVKHALRAAYRELDELWSHLHAMPYSHQDAGIYNRNAMRRIECALTGQEFDEDSADEDFIYEKREIKKSLWDYRIDPETEEIYPPLTAEDLKPGGTLDQWNPAEDPDQTIRGMWRSQWKLADSTARLPFEAPRKRQTRGEA